MLPPMFILHGEGNRYCIFQSSIINSGDPPVWKLEVVDQPKFLLQNAQYINDYILDRRFVVVHQRVSRSGEIKQFQSTVIRQTNYFTINGIGILPILKFTKKAGLPHKYHAVVDDEDPEQKWHFCMNAEGRIEGLPIHISSLNVSLPSVSASAPAPAPAPPPIPSQPSLVPLHVFYSYVAYEQQRGTLCPISLEPLKSTDRIAAPPCCHLFHSNALTHLQDLKCPVCRIPFTQDQLRFVSTGMSTNQQDPQPIQAPTETGL